MKNKIWFDITNTPQVHFLLAIRNILDDGTKEFVFSAREFSETTKLLSNSISEEFMVFGGHAGKNRLLKIKTLLQRFSQVYKSNIDYDISISNGSENAIWLSKLRGKKSIAFGDNDLAKQWTYSRFVDFSFFPNAIDESILLKQGISKKKLYLYNGFKEDLYIANYIPNKSFLNTIPFKEYVVLRPENISANYVGKSTFSITPRLLDLLNQKGINVVFLPRYETDRDYLNRNFSNVFIPNSPLNGLDLCYYSNAVLTGAGTLAREAACLGIPSFSFFTGNRLLAVDQKLVNKRKIFFSRNPDEIIKYLLKSSKNQPDFTRSIEVKNEVSKKLFHVVNELLI